MLSQALIIAIGIATEAIQSGQPKPSCTAFTRGLMWPLEANSSSKLAFQFSREGTLEICMRGSWKYRWTAPAVHVRQLQKSARIKSED